MLGFWMLEVSSFLYLVNTLNFFVSGHFLPYRPHGAGGPGHYSQNATLSIFGLFSAAVFLDKIPAQQILPLIGVQILWVVFFALAARILWRLGLKRYSAFGG